MFLYDSCKNQTQQSRPWVSSSDAHLKYTVYGLFDMYMDHGKGSATALDLRKHNRLPFIVLYES